MPRLVHDAGAHAELKRRVQSLTPQTPRQWGKMTIGQMLFHVNLVLAEAMGEYKGKRSIHGLPRVLVRWMILNGPWGKGAPTRPDMLVQDAKEFEKEKARCIDMLDRFAAKSMEGDWPEAANFPMTGRHWSQLNWRHLDHHLRQFGV
jgi:hypothetical protein